MSQFPSAVEPPVGFSLHTKEFFSNDGLPRDVVGLIPAAVAEQMQQGAEQAALREQEARRLAGQERDLRLRTARIKAEEDAVAADVSGATSLLGSIAGLPHAPAARGAAPILTIPSVQPKLMFFGDPHGDFKPVIRAVEQGRPEAIILLGDIQARQPLHLELASIRRLTDIWFIHGNHDTDTQADYDNLFGSELADRNLHGRVVEVAGYRVAGLGGIFRERIWHPEVSIDEAAFASPDHLLRHARNRRFAKPRELWREGIGLRHRSTIFPSDVLAFTGLQADVLVSHEAPGAHRHGFRVLDELAISLDVQLLVHGHHHEFVDYREEGRMDASSPFRAFGVDMGSHLAWPLQEGGPLP